MVYNKYMKKLLSILIAILLFPSLVFSQVNVPQGGTGTTTFSTGGVLFGDTTLRLTSDPASFSYNKNTDTLSVSTSSLTRAAIGQGSVSMPALSFIGDSDTGIYQESDGQIKFTRNGVETMSIQANGIVFGSETIPIIANIMYDYGTNLQSFRLNNTDAMIWTNGIQRMTVTNSGNVGIGTTSPYASLSVSGRGVFNQDVRADYYTSTSTTIASQFPYASTTALTVSGNLYNSSLSNGCLNVTSGLIGSTGSSCGAGTVTSVATNNGLTGGPITTTGTIGLNTTGLSVNALTTWDGSNLVSTGTPQLAVGNLVATSTNATSTFAGGFAVKTSSLVVENTTGRVGIGTAAPRTVFEVAGATPSTVRLGTTNTGYFTDYVNQVNSLYPWYVEVNNYGRPFGMKDFLHTTSAATTMGGFYGLVFSTNATDPTEASIRMVIDQTGLIGMGTATPAWKAQIATTAAPQLALTDTAASTNMKHWVFRSAGGNLYIATSTDAYATSSNSGLTMLNGGNVGIASTTPWRTLSVNGTMAVNGLTSATGGTNRAVCISATTKELIEETTGACTVSSKRFKNSIESLNVDTLSLLSDLRPVIYSPNSDDSSDFENKQFGFIAEEVAETNPHLAKYGLDGLPRTLDDRGIMAVITKAVQEIWIKVQSHESRIEKLERQNAELLERIENLEKQL